jgi:uroporphyrinogen-III decarboxylase
MEIYFQDLVLERENIDKLHDMVTTAMEKVIVKIGETTGADAIMFAEDWGIQDRLLINPEMWREIFKPLYVRLCKAARSVKLKVIMHSCGYNWAIIDDLAEVGINALQFDQPSLYGLEKLSDRLQQHKVALFSPVDIQKVYISGDKKRIQDEARKMVKLFFRGKGGFLAGSYGDLKGIGVREEWEEWAYEAFMEFVK